MLSEDEVIYASGVQCGMKILEYYDLFFVSSSKKEQPLSRSPWIVSFLRRLLTRNPCLSGAVNAITLDAFRVFHNSICIDFVE